MVTFFQKKKKNKVKWLTTFYNKKIYKIVNIFRLGLGLTVVRSGKF